MRDALGQHRDKRCRRSAGVGIFIAASTTPLAVLVLDGRLRSLVLACSWIGALGGISRTVLWIDARTLVALSCVLVSWAALVGLPQMLERLPTTPLALLASGGLLYMIGAAVYAARRPTRGRRSSASMRSSIGSWSPLLSCTSSRSPAGSCNARRGLDA
jgi:channel protein (hemolysin III family)